MAISSKRLMESMKALDFIRLSTTEGERKAAEIIAGKIREAGGEPELQVFKAPHYEIEEVSFEVTEPFRKKYTVTGYGFSGNDAADGIEAEFAYVENAEPIDLTDARGKIVLISGGISPDTMKRLVEAGVKGFVSPSGLWYDRASQTDLEERMFRPMHLENGKVPGVAMRSSDCISLVKSGAKKVRLTLRQTEGEGDSQNVIAEIKGKKHPDQVVTFTAHYDSVVFSHGAYDNAAGSAVLLELYRYFTENVPDRTARFIWCGSEERGLLGSKAYIAANEGKLDNVLLSINVDLAGSVLGRDTAIVLADKSLLHYIEFMYKKTGFPMSARYDTYSSDCIPFADAGIPAVNFVRFANGGSAVCHNRYDLLSQMDGRSLARTASFVAAFAGDMMNSVLFPVERVIPDDMKEKIDKYLRKKELKK